MAPEISTNEALQRVVTALEGIDQSLEPIGDFFATLDVAIQEFPNGTDKVTAAGCVRQYKQAAEALASEEDEPEPGA